MNIKDPFFKRLEAGLIDLSSETLGVGKRRMSRKLSQDGSEHSGAASVGSTSGSAKLSRRRIGKQETLQTPAIAKLSKTPKDVPSPAEREVASPSHRDNEDIDESDKVFDADDSRGESPAMVEGKDNGDDLNYEAAIYSPSRHSSHLSDAVIRDSHCGSDIEPDEVTAEDSIADADSKIDTLVKDLANAEGTKKQPSLGSLLHGIAEKDLQKSLQKRQLQQKFNVIRKSLSGKAKDKDSKPKRTIIVDDDRDGEKIVRKSKKIQSLNKQKQSSETSKTGEELRQKEVGKNSEEVAGTKTLQTSQIETISVGQETKKEKIPLLPLPSEKIPTVAPAAPSAPTANSAKTLDGGEKSKQQKESASNSEGNEVDLKSKVNYSPFEKN